MIDWEGPLAFAERAAHKLPARAADIRAIAALYAHARYGRDAGADALAELKARVAEFQP